MLQFTIILNFFEMKKITKRLRKAEKKNPSII